MFKNNKGFSLIEVLVTVGLIGVLVGIAVPQYGKYKQSTNLMAMKADLGNGMKTYTAYDAVNDTFCANFKEVGFNITPTSSVWKRNAFIGFGAVNTADCNKAVTEATDYQLGLQYQSGSADLILPGIDTKSPCDGVQGTFTLNAGSTTMGTCKGGAAFKFQGAVSTDCVLGADSFVMGAASESAGTIIGTTINRMIQVKDNGAISEETGAACVQ